MQSVVDVLPNDLILDEKGIYHSKTKSEISYPPDQNQNCMQFEDKSFWFKHRNNCLIEMVRDHAPPGYILDIGGGNGFVSRGLQNSGQHIILLEPGIHGALNAKNRGIQTVICSTFQDAGFKPKSLPAAGMFDVLEHIEDDSSMLKSIHDVLIENGMLYLSVPAYKWLWSDLDDDAGHHHRYTKSSMTKLLQSAGFKTIYSSYIFSILPIPIFLFRSLPSLVSRIKKHDEIVKKKKAEHEKKSMLLDQIWKSELNHIKKNKTLSFGGTLIVAAQKINS